MMPENKSMETLLSDRPFKLGTTSFIFPDHILPNVEKLGGVFDEIELLVFESRPARVLPSKADVKALSALSGKLNLTYNIHLPTDVDLCCASVRKRQEAKDTLLAVIDLFAPLCPTTHTLHLEMPEDVQRSRGNQRLWQNWEKATRQGLSDFVSGLPDPGIVTIETLEYPFSLVEPMVKEFNLSVCMDAGHGIKYGHAFLDTFEAHQARIPLVHLHGVDFSVTPAKDHTALDALPENYAGQIITMLKKFTGVVSLGCFPDPLIRAKGFS